MVKEQKKIQNSEYDTEVLKPMMDWFDSVQEHHQGTTMLLVNRLKVLSAWNDVLHGGLMVTIGMVFYLSFRFALLELVFKWNENQVKLHEVLKAIDYTPLFGTRSGRNGTTIWLVFMKLSNTECNQ